MQNWENLAANPVPLLQGTSEAGGITAQIAFRFIALCFLFFQQLSEIM
jgi:hypothetical protein